MDKVGRREVLSGVGAALLASLATNFLTALNASALDSPQITAFKAWFAKWSEEKEANQLLNELSPENRGVFVTALGATVREFLERGENKGNPFQIIQSTKFREIMMNKFSEAGDAWSPMIEGDSEYFLGIAKKLLDSIQKYPCGESI